MSTPPDSSERVDLRVQFGRVFLSPLSKIFQNEVCFVLIIILCAGAYGAILAVNKFELFIKEQVPQHIEAINRGTSNVAKQFSEDLRGQREHYTELRKIDEINIDRIERLATGRKTTAVATPQKVEP